MAGGAKEDGRMTAPAAGVERAAQHEAAQKKLRATLRQEFPFAAKRGDEVRAVFKDARVVEAQEGGAQHGQPLTGLVDSGEVLMALADDAKRRKKR
jgi:hypothetical protein